MLNHYQQGTLLLLVSFQALADLTNLLYYVLIPFIIFLQRKSIFCYTEGSGEGTELHREIKNSPRFLVGTQRK